MATTKHAADTLRTDVAQLADDLAVLVQALRDGAIDEIEAKLAAIRGKAARFGAPIQDCGAAKLEAGAALVRNRPLASLAATFAAGWLVGRLFGR